MQSINIFDIEGMEFPAGRRTRVVVGPNCTLEAKNFVQGYVVIYPGGYIPVHDHKEEETYTIISGTGEMSVGDETKTVKAGDATYIPPGFKHGLKNTGTDDMVMIFVYAPKVIAEHWQQETSGELK